MNRNLLLYVMSVLAAAGVSVSAYLTYLSVMPPSSCLISEFSIFSCDRVIWSQYSRFYGVPVAPLGLAWFLIALGLIVITWRDRKFTRYVLAWSLLGAAGVAGFVYTELFLLGAVCPWCTVAHILGLGILVFSLAAVRTYRS
jgi:uncharacterized membrane protein